MQNHATLLNPAVAFIAALVILSSTLAVASSIVATVRSHREVAQ